MAWLAAAVGGSALIGAGANLFGAKSASAAQQKAAQEAAAAQRYAVDQATGVQRDALAQSRDYFNQSVGYAQPYMDFGGAQLGTLNKLLTPGSDMSAVLAQTPGYKFAFDQANKAIGNQASATGLGGNALRAAADYGAGSAQKTYGDIVNQLMNAAGIGQRAASGIGSNAVQTGAIGVSGANGMANSLINGTNNVAGSIMAGGNAQAAGDIAMGNAIGQGASGISNAFLLNQLLQRGGSSGAYGMYGNKNIG